MKYTLQQIKRHTRRWLLIMFRPYYVMTSLSNRRGECKRCGCCRAIKETIKFPKSAIICSYFTIPNVCLKWNDLPLVCKLYPIDEKDKNEFSKNTCGFYWVEPRTKAKQITPPSASPNKLP